MIKFFKDTIRSLVLKNLPNSAWLRSLFQYAVYRDFCKKNKASCPMFDLRDDMYNYINNNIIQNKAIKYLEFGVYKGNSLNYISSINSNENSTFTGFDSFEGLPEDWIEFNGAVNSKKFNVKGNIPVFSDKRIFLVKGLFQDTLPNYLDNYNANEQLIINNDSDLYSSTMYMLTSCNDIIRKGTVIIFDEFFSAMHEFRALEDYCSSYRRSYDIVAATHNYRQITIIMH